MKMLSYLAFLSFFVGTLSDGINLKKFRDNMSQDGGLSQLKPADAEVQKICDQVKLQVEEMAGQDFPEFKAISYKTQVVAGTNYFIKVHVGGPSYVHLRVFQPLPGDGSIVTLTAIKTGMTKDDPITYFD